MSLSDKRYYFDLYPASLPRDLSGKNSAFEKDKILKMREIKKLF